MPITVPTVSTLHISPGRLFFDLCQHRGCHSVILYVFLTSGKKQKIMLSRFAHKKTLPIFRNMGEAMETVRKILEINGYEYW